jgi:hypothetical protein
MFSTLRRPTAVILAAAVLVFTSASYSADLALPRKPGAIKQTPPQWVMQPKDSKSAHQRVKPRHQKKTGSLPTLISPTKFVVRRSIPLVSGTTTPVRPLGGGALERWGLSGQNSNPLDKIHKAIGSPAPLQFGLPRMFDEVASPPPSSLIIPLPPLDAPRETVLAPSPPARQLVPRSNTAIMKECLEAHFLKFSERSPELNISGPLQSGRALQSYTIVLTGPSAALSQRTDDTWERIVIIVHERKLIGPTELEYTLFMTITEIQHSPSNVRPPQGRYREMGREHVPLLTQFQESIAGLIHECLEHQLQ